MQNKKKLKQIKNGQFSFFYILQLPHTVISNSEKLTHPSVQYTVYTSLQIFTIHFFGLFPEYNIFLKIGIVTNILMEIKYKSSNFSVHSRGWTVFHITVAIVFMELKNVFILINTLTLLKNKLQRFWILFYSLLASLIFFPVIEKLTRKF